MSGINVRSSTGPIIFRVGLDDGNGNPVTGGTTTLHIFEVQSDGSLHTYDWSTNTFSASTVTTFGQNMVNRSVNGGTGQTGIWTFSLSTVAGFTKGNVYIADVFNTLASPSRWRTEFQFGGADGDLVVNGDGSVNSTSSEAGYPSTSPSAPQGLALTYDSINKVVDVSWTANPEANIIAYRLFRGSQLVQRVTTNSTVDNPGAISGFKYTYFLTAINSANKESAPSASVSITIP